MAGARESDREFFREFVLALVAMRGRDPLFSVRHRGRRRSLLPLSAGKAAAACRAASGPICVTAGSGPRSEDRPKPRNRLSDPVTFRETRHTLSSMANYLHRGSRRDPEFSNVTPTEPALRHRPLRPPRSERRVRIFSDELGGFSKSKAGSVMIEFLWLGMFFSITDSGTTEVRSSTLRPPHWPKGGRCGS